MKEQHFS